MYINISILLIVSFVLGNGFSGKAQTFQNPEIKIIEKTFDSYEEKFQKPGQDEFIQLQYTMSVTTTLTKDEKITTNCQVYMNANCKRFITQDMDVLQDGEISVSVLKDQKTIYINHVGATDQREILIERIASSQSEMLSYVENSEMESLDNHKVKIVLYFDEEGRSRFNLKKAIYHIDTNANRLLKSSAFYTPGFSYQRVDIVFNSITRHSGKCSQLPTSALSLVMDDNNRIRNAFSNYQLMDVRTK